jgi:phosphatidylglycerophosphatase C
VKKEIAFFDFDGTITTKDTLLEFIKFTKGSFRFYLGFLLHFHYIAAFKLKLITNQRAKEKILSFFFKNTSVEKFTEDCVRFSNEVLPRLIRPKAMTEIRQLQEKNTIVVIVSASPEDWIKLWSEKNKLEIIASRLEIINGKVTGKLIGKNCHGEEKVCRITDQYDLSRYHVVAAYGDSGGDKPMLRLASKPHYKPFRN